MRVEIENFMTAFFWHPGGHEGRKPPATVIVLDIFVQLESEILAQSRRVDADFL